MRFSNSFKLGDGFIKVYANGKPKCVNVLSMQTYKSGKDPTAIATDISLEV